MDRPACPWRPDRRCGLCLGQRLTAHLHTLGQRTARYGADGVFPSWLSVQSGNSSVRLYPDSGDGSCVAMAADKIGAFWDDKQCSEKFFFFCEKFRPDITPPTKAPTPPPSQGCADGWTAQPHFRNCYKVTIRTNGAYVSEPSNAESLCRFIFSSSTTWTGPRRRAGEQLMRTA